MGRFNFDTSVITTDCEVPEEVELGAQLELYLSKCEKICKELYQNRDRWGICALVVYGSLARGTLGMTSDIDILVLMDCEASEVRRRERQIMMQISPEYMDEFPYLDLRATRLGSYLNPTGPEFSSYIENCKRDGVYFWLN